MSFAHDSEYLFLLRGPKEVGCPNHWVTPFFGKVGQLGSSKHNLAATSPFADLSTSLDSLNVSVSNGAHGVKIGVVDGKKLSENRM